jgi:hypothetical protein
MVHDTTYRAALTGRRRQLQACLMDLLSEYDDAMQALDAARRGGPCVTFGVLLARRDACLADVRAVQHKLSVLERLTHARAS